MLHAFQFFDDNDSSLRKSRISHFSNSFWFSKRNRITEVSNARTHDKEKQPVLAFNLIEFDKHNKV